MHAEKLHAEKQFFDVIQITNRVTLLARKSSGTRKTSFRFASRYLYPSPRQLGGKTEEGRKKYLDMVPLHRTSLLYCCPTLLALNQSSDGLTSVECWSFQVIGHTTPSTEVVYTVWACVHQCTYVLGVSTYEGGLTVGLPDTRVLFIELIPYYLTALKGNCGAAAGMWHSLN
jgi:hypothetical protein